MANSNKEAEAYARHCYKHLAGQIGVSITSYFTTNNYLKATKSGEYVLTKDGYQYFSNLGIDLGSIKLGRNQKLARPCLDNTEKKPHLAGKLGDRFLQFLLDNDLAYWHQNSRKITFSPAGKKFLKEMSIG